MSTEYLSVGAFAKAHGASPKSVSDWIYRHIHRIGDDACPIVFGRRCIPISFAEELARILRREGVIRQEQEAVHA